MSGLTLVIRKAVKTMGRLRLGLVGPAGSGKTFTSLAIATIIAKLAGKRVLLIDTEHGSAAKYAGDSFFGGIFDFDVLPLEESQHPLAYVEALNLAAKTNDYAVVIIDSLSHAWIGKDGALAEVDRIAKRSGSGNNFTAWRDVTPMHNALVEAMLAFPLHLIVTIRAKTEYVMEVNERGKSVPKKVGMAPIQRDGLEYEFDIVGDMTLDNTVSFSKTRCSALKGKVFEPTSASGDNYEKCAGIISGWLSDGAPADAAPEIKVSAVSTPEQILAPVVPAAPEVPAAPKKPTYSDILTTERARLGKVYDKVLFEFGVEDALKIEDLAQKVAIVKALQAAAPAAKGKKSDKLAADLAA